MLWDVTFFAPEPSNHWHPGVHGANYEWHAPSLQLALRPIAQGGLDDSDSLVLLRNGAPQPYQRERELLGSSTLQYTASAGSAGQSAMGQHGLRGQQPHGLRGDAENGVLRDTASRWEQESGSYAVMPVAGQAPQQAHAAGQGSVPYGAYGADGRSRQLDPYQLQSADTTQHLSSWGDKSSHGAQLPPATTGLYDVGQGMGPGQGRSLAPDPHAGLLRQHSAQGAYLEHAAQAEDPWPIASYGGNLVLLSNLQGAGGSEYTYGNQYGDPPERQAPPSRGLQQPYYQNGGNVAGQMLDGSTRKAWPRGHYGPKPDQVQLHGQVSYTQYPEGHLAAEGSPDVRPDQGTERTQGQAHWQDQGQAAKRMRLTPQPGGGRSPRGPGQYPAGHGPAGERQGLADPGTRTGPAFQRGSRGSSATGSADVVRGLVSAMEDPEVNDLERLLTLETIIQQALADGKCGGSSVARKPLDHGSLQQQSAHQHHHHDQQPRSLHALPPSPTPVGVAAAVDSLYNGVVLAGPAGASAGAMHLPDAISSPVIGLDLQDMTMLLGSNAVTSSTGTGGGKGSAAGGGVAGSGTAISRRGSLTSSDQRTTSVKGGAAPPSGAGPSVSSGAMAPGPGPGAGAAPAGSAGGRGTDPGASAAGAGTGGKPSAPRVKLAPLRGPSPLGPAAAGSGAEAGAGAGAGGAMQLEADPPRTASARARQRGSAASEAQAPMPPSPTAGAGGLRGCAMPTPRPPLAPAQPAALGSLPSAVSAPGAARPPDGVYRLSLLPPSRTAGADAAPEGALLVPWEAANALFADALACSVTETVVQKLPEGAGSAPVAIRTNLYGGCAFAALPASYTHANHLSPALPAVTSAAVAAAAAAGLTFSRQLAFLNASLYAEQLAWVLSDIGPLLTSLHVAEGGEVSLVKRARDGAVVVAAVEDEADTGRRGRYLARCSAGKLVLTTPSVAGLGLLPSDPEDVVQALNGGGVAVRLAAAPRTGDGPVVPYKGATLHCHAAQVTLRGVDGLMAALGVAAGGWVDVAAANAGKGPKGRPGELGVGGGVSEVLVVGSSGRMAGAGGGRNARNVSELEGPGAGAGGCVSLLPDGFVPRRWTRAPPEVLHPISAAWAGLEPEAAACELAGGSGSGGLGPGGGSGFVPGAATSSAPAASVELPIEFLPLPEGEASRVMREGARGQRASAAVRQVYVRM